MLLLELNCLRKMGWNNGCVCVADGERMVDVTVIDDVTFYFFKPVVNTEYILGSNSCF